MVSLKAFNALQSRARLARILPLALIAIAVTALHSLVDFPLQVASLQLYFLTYLGLCWGSLGHEKTRSDLLVAARSNH